MRHFYFLNSKIFWGGSRAPSPVLTPLCPLNSSPLANTSSVGSGSATGLSVQVHCAYDAALTALYPVVSICIACRRLHRRQSVGDWGDMVPQYFAGGDGPPIISVSGSLTRTRL